MTDAPAADGRLLSRRAFGLGAAALVSSGGPALPQASARAQGSLRIEVQATAISAFEPRDPQRRIFGALAFRGGLALTSPQPRFGGLSSLRMMRDGAHFLAVTDRGDWLRARVLYEGEAPAGITEAEMAPILGPDGRPFRTRRWYDAESLAEDGGTVFVGYERVHGIARFDYARYGLGARGKPIAVPPRLKELGANKGIESLVAVPRGLPLAGTLIAISERGARGAEDSLGFLLGGPEPGEFTLLHSEEFDVTDVALTARGDLLVLERYFSFFRGLRARIRRLPLREIKPGATVGGTVLWEADLGQQIDNLEGIAVHTAPTGDTVLTLISDDNFSRLQRTLLLQFTLTEP